MDIKDKKQLRKKGKRLGLTLQTFKISLAAGIAWGLATLFTPNLYPYIAPLTAVLIVNTTLAKSATKAINRLLGVLGGVGASLIVMHWFQPSSLALFLSILLGMSFTTACRLHQDAASQVGVTTVMVLAFAHSGNYEWGRIIETIIGAGVAIAITVFPFSGLVALLKKMFGPKKMEYDDCNKAT